MLFPSPPGACTMLKPYLVSNGLTSFNISFKGAYLLLKNGLLALLAGFLTSD